MKAKIIGFTKYPDGQDADCIAITDKGEKIIVDPFVGCSWKYENREHLLNQWFEDEKAFKVESGVWLTDEHSFRLLPSNLNPPCLTTMTINETVKKAIEGGWLGLENFGDEKFSDAYLKSVWGNGIACLDPLFFQALGKSLGWEEYSREKKNYFGTYLNHWHRLIDHLAEGGSIETYFASLL